MKAGILFGCLLSLTLSVACGPVGELVLATPSEKSAGANIPLVPVTPTNMPVSGQNLEQPTHTVVSTDPDCPGQEINRIGQAIADEYDFAGYEEVMTWFCGGAEFEDILVALQTEELTGTPTEELLVMLSEGFSWDEIWQVIELGN